MSSPELVRLYSLHSEKVASSRKFRGMAFVRVRRVTPFQWMTSLDYDEFTSSVLNLCQWIFLAQMGTQSP